MLALIWAAIVLFIATVLFLLSPYKWHSSKTYQLLEKLPGPKIVPFFGNMLEFRVSHVDLLPKIVQMARDYGSLFKIRILGNNGVFVLDPRDIEVVLTSTVHISKSKSYLFLHPWLGTGLLTSTGRKWQTRRKILTPTFHFKILEDYVHVFNANSDILVDSLGKRTGEIVDINSIITLCTLDIICETAMGNSVNAQTGGEVEYIKAVKRMGELFQQRQLTFWMHNDWVFQFTAAGKEQKKVLGVLHGFTESMIKKKRVEYLKRKSQIPSDEISKPKRLAFLDLLIEISERDGELNDMDIREEVDTFMFEGHDTTASGISWAIFLLGHNPDVQERVWEELNAIFSSGGDYNRQPTITDLQSMSYLDRVIKEVLRLYPSVPGISRTLDTDLVIRDTTIPAGTYVPIIPYIVHRNPEIFPNPEEFNPDNFLPETATGRHPFSYIPFSAGPRNCIGQKFARLEEKAVLSSLVRNFTFESLDKREDVKLMMEMILKPQHGLRMKFAPRC